MENIISQRNHAKIRKNAQHFLAPSSYFGLLKKNISWKKKMKSLVSNGPLSTGKWMGSDTTLEYPGVDTCITVTCLVGNKLIGCHLFHNWQFPYNTNDRHERDITEFAKAAKKLGAVRAIYIVGNIDHWGEQIATLREMLTTKLGYIGGFGSSERSLCKGNIKVTLTGPVALEVTQNDTKVNLKMLDGSGEKGRYEL